MSPRNTLSILLLSVSLPATLAACGSDNTLSKSEARRAFVDVMTASQSVSAEAQAGCTSCAVSTATGSVACPGGGSADFDGSIDDAGPITMDLSLGFTGCAGPNGTVIDGTLDYSTSVSNDGDFEFSMLGALQFDGAVSGSCDFDLSLSLADGVYSAQGDLCGDGFAYP